MRNVRLNGRPVSGGSDTVTPPDGETLYVLTAEDLLGDPVDGGSETVTSVGRPVLGPLEADDTWVFHNDRVTLTWREENVRNVRLNGRPVSGGSETVTPPDGETLYVLTARICTATPSTAEARR